MSGCRNFIVIAITFYVLSDHKRTNLDIKNRNEVQKLVHSTEWRLGREKNQERNLKLNEINLNKDEKQHIKIYGMQLKQSKKENL